MYSAIKYFLARQRSALSTLFKGSPLHPFFERLNARIVSRFPVLGNHRLRTGLSFVVATIVVVQTIMFAQYLMLQPTYVLGSAKSLLTPISQSMAERVEYDSEQQLYLFNDGYVANPADVAQTFGPQITASAHVEAADGLTVTDPAYKTSFTLKPEFSLFPGKKDGNRIIYPLRTGKGWLVYGMHSTSVKEDVLLTESPGDEFTLRYTLELSAGTEARLEADGGIGIYGNTLLLGDITTGSDEDEELLDTAREASSKESLLFSIPAPVVIEADKSTSETESIFKLDGNTLEVVTKGLDDATYPLSIDPSIYVETAEKFMRGNNETNIDFDTQNSLIQKGKTTGARFDAMTGTLAMPDSRWSHGTASAGGYVYAVGGKNGSTNQSSVYWAKFNTLDYTIGSPNPGDGTCTGWCTDSEYDLPSPRSALSVVAYNGFLYAIGGEDSSCTTGNGTGDSGICSTVYVTKIGANGEPSLWHPTDSDQANWEYWHRIGDLSSTRSYTAAVAYENRMYLLGGKSHSDLGGVTTVESANIRPTGTLTAWSTDGMSALPAGAGRQYHSAEVYNDRIYVIGGAEGTLTTGNIVSSVFYTKVDGETMNGWSETNSLAAPRMTWGGSFSAVFGGHIYQTGGCSAVNVSGNCTAIEESTQFASINTIGNLTPWRSIEDANNQFIGHSIETWNGALYNLGGCSAQDGTTGACSSTSLNTSYAQINEPGDITRVSTSSASGSGSCSGGSPYDCNLPATGDSAGQGGQLLAASVVVRGYLYVIGGCVNTGCTNISGNVSYARISTSGTLSRPDTCSGTYSGSWCVDSTNRVNGTTGVAAAGIATYGNTIYIVGGTNGSANTNTIYRNSVNNNGSLSGAWTSQSLTGVGGASVAHTFAYARANPSDASANPANLYIVGGCTTTSAADCTGNSYSTAVHKCNIQTSGAVAGCTTSGQLQIDSEPGTGGNQGLGLHSGMIYANYIYLTGGVSQTTSSKNSVLYAKFDNSNNIVAASGSQWTQASEVLGTGRSASVSYGYNGYLYTMGGFNTGSNTVLQSVEAAKINAIDGSIEPFSTYSTTISSRWGMTVGVSSSMVYVLGGCSSGAGTGSCSSLTPSVQTIQIHNNESGAPEGYSASSNLFATDRIAASAAVLNGYLYIAGGCTDSATCATTTSNVQYAQLDSSGNVGTWSNTAATLPANRAWGQLEVAGNSLYFIGGQGDAGNASAAVYYATPSSGNVSSWSTASNSLPAARTLHSATVWDDRIFVTGGNNSSNVAQNTVYVSPQLSSGGDISSGWSTAGSFNVARSGLTAIAYANNLYILGGYTGSAHLSDVQYAKINSDGTLGSWSYSTNLPMPIQQADGFAANGYMYLFGGRSGNTEADCQDRTYVAPISANTAISSGNNPTGLGSWFEASAQYGGLRYGIATAYHDGQAYLLGGGCSELLNQSELYASPGTFTFVATEDTNNVVVEAWGGGGGGGSGDTGAGNAAGAGAGGGGYARGSVSVTPGNYTVTVGAGGAGGVPGENGGNSWFDSASTVFAAGGTGASWGSTIGTGGTANIGSDATFNGGNGGTGYDTATPNNRRGGGGGGSAFFNANGNNGTDGTGSAGSGIGGSGTGTGGNGGNRTSDGGAGGVPGAGGGGGGHLANGGNGAAGRVIVYYDEWSELVLSGNQRVTVATLASQPQVANYSYLIDTDTDVFPQTWLMNGVDNFIGARWNLSYRSMNNTDGIADNCGTSDMSSLGQATYFGEVTLGQPEPYIVRNGSGDDIGCARYFHLLLSIDATRTYGYPDDVSRGPTVSDITMQFTADPSKRLLHGRTFTGGLQQPIDTPYYPY